MNDIMNIGGIECFEKDGTAYLKLETVAWGLGFTKSEVKNGKEYATVRWERVFGFLKEIGFDHSWSKNRFYPRKHLLSSCYESKERKGRTVSGQDCR